MINFKEFEHSTGVDTGFFNVGGAGCQAACYQYLNSAKRHKCQQVCTDMKINKKQDKFNIKNPKGPAEPAYTPEAEAPSAPDQGGNTGGGGMSTGMIVGISVGGLVLVGAIVFLVTRN